MEVIINYWAVLLSAVAGIALGAFWYGPLFGKQWMRMIGMEMPSEITKAMQKQMMKSYIIQAIACFVMAFVFAHLLAFANDFMGTEGILANITGAVWVWAGFIAPATLGSVLWEGRPWKYWFIVAGYYLVALIGMGVIFAVWQ